MRHPTRRKEHVREVTDPVCGMRVDPRFAISRLGPDGHPHFFCAPVCANQYTKATSLAAQVTDSS
jgi:YHS domain-containing protein